MNLGLMFHDPRQNNPYKREGLSSLQNINHERKMEGNERNMNGHERKMKGKWKEIKGT